MAGILTVAQQQQVWHDFVDQFQKIGVNQAAMPFSITDLTAAVQAADAWVTANQASYNTALPDPFKTNASTTFKAALLAYVIMRRFTG